MDGPVAQSMVAKAQMMEFIFKSKLPVQNPSE
jgi:hypothetical protein